MPNKANNTPDPDSTTTTDAAAPRRTGTATGQRASRSSPQVALYSTHGRHVAGANGDDHDDRVEQFFGQQVLAATVDASRFYLRVKLVDPPQRPQTYFARIDGLSGTTWSTAVEALDEFVGRSQFERGGNPRHSQFQAGLATAPSNTAVTESLANPDLLDAARRTGSLEESTFRFTVGTAQAAADLNRAIADGVGTGVVILTDDAGSSHLTGTISDVEAIVVFDETADGISAMPETRRALQEARNALDAKRRREALDRIESGIEELTRVESTATDVRTAVEELLPSTDAGAHNSAAPRASGTTSGPGTIGSDTRRPKRARSQTGQSQGGRASDRNASSPVTRHTTGQVLPSFGRGVALVLFGLGLVGGVLGGLYALESTSEIGMGLLELGNNGSLLVAGGSLLVVALIAAAVIWRRLSRR